MNRPMKTISIILMVLLLLLGCDFLNNRETIKGSGKITTMVLNDKDFTGISLENVFKATIHQGREYSIELTMDDNLQPLLDIEKSRGELEFGLSDDYNYKDVTLQLEITMPDLSRLFLSGATDADIQNMTLDHSVVLDCSGASDITGTLTSGDIEMDISGASSITLGGHAGKLELDVSGASHANLEQFTTADAEIDISGASKADVRVTGTLKGEASGVSKLRYWGHPATASVETSGASSAKSMDE